MKRDLLLELALLPPEKRDRVIAKMSVPMKVEMAGRWHTFAHGGQYRPDKDWRVWLIRAGRGFGKTRAGAEWVNEIAREVPGARIALVGATAEEARRVMVEGPSGVIATARLDVRPVWTASKGEVRWPGGAVATVYSADAPEGLRGPEHHAAWCDELAKWRRGEATWDNLMMTMRLGSQPRVMVTTTPRSTTLMRRVMTLPGLHQTTGRTGDNIHLPAAFVDSMNETYGGTAQGEWPAGYDAQVRAGYLGNAAAQRAVRLVAEAVGSAPLDASDPALLALVTARAGGGRLAEVVAAQVLLHGNAFIQVLRGATRTGRWRNSIRCVPSG
jgi:phage terminase large subunit-like protein